MIRSARAQDLPAIIAIAASTTMFMSDELDHFRDLLASLFHQQETLPNEAGLLVALNGPGDEADIVGAAFFMLEPMAQGIMNLLFIGVAPEARKRGFGRALLDSFGEAVQEHSARLAIIETAGDKLYEPAWRLYEAAGFRQEACIRDYYDDGLDKLIFSQRFAR